MAKATEDNSAPLEQFETLPRRIMVVYLPLAVFVFVLLFPFYWMAITAVKPDNQLTDYDNYSPFWVVAVVLAAQDAVCAGKSNKGLAVMAPNAIHSG